MDFAQIEAFETQQTLLPAEICYLQWKHFDMPPHVHSPGSIELNYIVDGICYYDFGDERFTLTKRNLLILNGSKPHKMVSPETCVNMSLNCSPCSLTPSMGSIQQLVTMYPALNKLFASLKTGYVVKNARQLWPVLQDIMNEYNARRDMMYLNLLVNKALIELAHLLEDKNPQTNAYVEKAKKYINLHYYSIRNIDEIAGHISINKVYLQRLFNQVEGIPLWRYLTNVRMEHACYLLKNTTTPVSDIDELVGIHSRQNFYRTFKSIYGISPSNYRKQNREELT